MLPAPCFSPFWVLLPFLTLSVFTFLKTYPLTPFLWCDLQTHAHIDIRTFLHTYTCIHMHVHIYTYVHTYTYTYVHTCTHIILNLRFTYERKLQFSLVFRYHNNLQLHPFSWKCHDLTFIAVDNPSVYLYHVLIIYLHVDEACWVHVLTSVHSANTAHLLWSYRVL